MSKELQYTSEVSVTHSHVFKCSHMHNSPRDHAQQNQRAAILCDQHGTGTRVVMQSHLDVSVPVEATKNIAWGYDY